MQKSGYEKRILTIPNVLTAFRILMIPAFVWLYRSAEHRMLAAVSLGVSAFSDMLDGWIARHFHMESNLGRVLDPLADKLTQAAMCLMLLSRYPIMLWVLVFFGVKEAALAAMGYAHMKRTGVVNSARWYGKASSIVQYAVVIGLILSPTITEYSAYVLLSICMLTHVLSLLLYVVFYIRSMRNPGHPTGVAMRPVDWQTMVMYLLLMGGVFLFLFTSGDSSLHDVLPKGIYLFLRFASIVITIGVMAFFIGERLPREKFNPEKFPFACWKWEDEGKFYDKLGLRYWKTHVPDMSKYIPKAFSKQGNFLRDPAHLRRLVQETCSAETVHWALIAVSFVFPIFMDELGLLAMALYIVGNLASIVIQRYNRPRIMKIIHILETRKPRVRREPQAQSNENQEQ